MTGSTAAAPLLGVIGLLAACQAVPPPPAAPPAIEFVGVPQEHLLGPTSATYVVPDGRTLEVETAGYRVLGPSAWSGALVILGSDSAGLFVASFMTQGGLPVDCYVENAVSIDRGGHIESRGDLWRKAPSFVAAVSIPPDHAHPSGTRFCFDASGEITTTIAP